MGDLSQEYAVKSLSLWERWICEAKTERAHAASLIAKVSRAMRNFAVAPEAPSQRELAKPIGFD